MRIARMTPTNREIFLCILHTYSNWYDTSIFFLSFQRFFCGGRLIFGPDVSSLFLSICLIAVPAVAFCIKIVLKIHDEKPPGNTRWFPVLFGGLSLTILVSFDLIGLKISLNISFIRATWTLPCYLISTHNHVLTASFIPRPVDKFLFYVSIFLVRLSI